MIRVCNVYLPLRLFAFVVVDSVVLVLLAVAALHPGVLHLHMLSPGHLPLIVLMFVAVLLWCMYLFDLYDLDVRTSGQQFFQRSLRALGCAVLLMAPAWWLMAPKDAQVEYLELSLLGFVVLLAVYRLLVEKVRSAVFPGERLLLIGSGPTIELLAGALQQRVSLPLRLSAAIQDPRGAISGVPHFATCGTLQDVDRLCELFRPTRIAVGSHDFNDPLLSQKLLEFRRKHIRVQDAISLYEALSGRLPVNHVDIRAMAVGDSFIPNRALFQIYRAFGMVFAVLLAIALSPFLLLIAIAIKLDSKGPVFYQQERVGMNGSTFMACKFRSMRTDAESSSGPVWATDNDPRVTRVGRILRTLRLDEFAQLWNVIKGEMCLVGPRPERPHFTAMLAEKIPFYDVRHSVPPGITGWAQVNASYGASVEESRVKLEYDLFYLNNQSPLLDALIIVKTIKIALFGRGAR